MKKFNENGVLVYEGYGQIPVWVEDEGERFTIYDGLSEGEEWEECKLELEQHVTEVEGEMHVESADDAEAVQSIYDKWLEVQQERYIREAEEAEETEEDKKKAEEATVLIAIALKDELDYYFSRPNGYDIEFDSHGGASYDSLEQATGLSMDDVEAYLYRAVYDVIKDLD